MNQEKRYIVRKYIMATSAQQALKRERSMRPDDCWVDETWIKDNPKELISAIGFTVNDYKD